jgi:hypothetical protein
MAQYLIVTHRTAFTSELRAKVAELIGSDPAAEFAILVPETPGEAYTWEGETVTPALQTAEALMQMFETDLGANVIRIATGVDDPLQAIGNELRLSQGYDTLVICTLPLGASQWLRRDVVHQATRKFGLPVVHVVGTPAES